MANINIANLPITGLDLFSDSENYLKELSEHEFSITGGISIRPINAFSSGNYTTFEPI
jgi:hypothetical protein